MRTTTYRFSYIYALLDPNTKQIRYVGKSNNPRGRLSDHISEAKNIRTHRHNWIKSLYPLEPELKILEECLESNWAERERWWIAHFKSKGHPLTNSTDGGEGVTWTPELRERIAQSRRGTTASPETKAKMSKTRKGRPLTEEQRQKRIGRKTWITKGSKLPEEMRIKISIGIKKSWETRERRTIPPEAIEGVKRYWKNPDPEHMRKRDEGFRKYVELKRDQRKIQ